MFASLFEAGLFKYEMELLNLTLSVINIMIVSLFIFVGFLVPLSGDDVQAARS